jgi:hypothetical protein
MQLLGRKSDNAGGSYAPAAPAAAPAAEPFASSNDSSDELPF